MPSSQPHRYLRHLDVFNSKKDKRAIYGKAYDTNKVSEMEDLF
jgi:hypothetical protein